MTKHRAVVTGWDPNYTNPDESTGRPKGVQTASDMRVATTYDVLTEGIFALHGVPTITTSPLSTIQVSPFMAAIESPNGGFYVVKITENETVDIDMEVSGAIKIYVRQQDWELENDLEAADSAVMLGVAYGVEPIPEGSLLLFTSTLNGETSTSELTFVPQFKWTGAASGSIRVPTSADLDEVAVIQTGTRALVIDGAGEFVYSGGEWLAVNPANNIVAAYPIGSIYMNATNNANPNTLLGFGTWTAFAKGRVPVGFDSAQSEFNAPEKTGGHKDMQAHGHSISPQASGVMRAGGSGRNQLASGSNASYTTLSADTAGTGDSGNLQPFITVYMWKRTA